MNETDRQYVLHSAKALIDWAKAIETDPGLRPSSYCSAIAEQAELIAQIARGKRRSPWTIEELVVMSLHQHFVCSLCGYEAATFVPMSGRTVEQTDEALHFEFIGHFRTAHPGVLEPRGTNLLANVIAGQAHDAELCNN